MAAAFLKKFSELVNEALLEATSDSVDCVAHYCTVKEDDREMLEFIHELTGSLLKQKEGVEFSDEDEEDEVSLISGRSVKRRLSDEDIQDVPEVKTRRLLSDVNTPDVIEIDDTCFAEMTPMTEWRKTHICLTDFNAECCYKFGTITPKEEVKRVAEVLASQKAEDDFSAGIFWMNFHLNDESIAEPGYCGLCNQGGDFKDDYRGVFTPDKKLFNLCPRCYQIHEKMMELVESDQVQDL